MTVRGENKHRIIGFSKVPFCRSSHYPPGSTFSISLVHHRPRKSPGPVPHAITGPGHSPGAGGDAVSAGRQILAN